LELETLLRATANKLVPESLGIGWSLLKKGWEVVKDHLLLIYNVCFLLGHHPVHWKEAKVVAIPKPDKLDYLFPSQNPPPDIAT
jgi:hypothetical protein